MSSHTNISIANKLVKAALFLACLSVSISSIAKEEQYSLGIFPHMPLSKLLTVYGPIADDFSNQLNHNVIALTKPTFNAYARELEKEAYDIALIQPFDYPMAYKHGYLPLARRDLDLTAIIIVKNNSSIDDIKMLKNKTIANPAPKAAVSLMTQKSLKLAGINPETDITTIYTGNHFSCMQNVLIGKADACGTARQALINWQGFKIKKRFKIIHETQPLPHALFVVHKRIPEASRKTIKESILSWPQRDEGKKILKKGNLVPFTEALDNDYDIIRNF